MVDIDISANFVLVIFKGPYHEVTTATQELEVPAGLYVNILAFAFVDFVGLLPKIIIIKYKEAQTIKRG